MCCTSSALFSYDMAACRSPVLTLASKSRHSTTKNIFSSRPNSTAAGPKASLTWPEYLAIRRSERQWQIVSSLLHCIGKPSLYSGRLQLYPVLYLVLWEVRYILERGTLILLNQSWYVDWKEIMVHAPVYHRVSGYRPILLLWVLYRRVSWSVLAVFPPEHQSYELQVRGPLSDHHSVQHYGEQDTVR